MMMMSEGVNVALRVKPVVIQSGIAKTSMKVQDLHLLRQVASRKLRRDETKLPCHRS